MIYKFKCAASGDVIMLAPNAEPMLRLLGREPAAQGIIEPADMPGAMAALQAAIEQEAATPASEDEPQKPPVSLRQRLWPMLDLLRRAHAADKPVVWGV